MRKYIIKAIVCIFLILFCQSTYAKFYTGTYERQYDYGTLVMRPNGTFSMSGFFVYGSNWDRGSIDMSKITLTGKYKVEYYSEGHYNLDFYVTNVSDRGHHKQTFLNSIQREYSGYWEENNTGHRFIEVQRCAVYYLTGPNAYNPETQKRIEEEEAQEARERAEESKKQRVRQEAEAAQRRQERLETYGE